MFCLLSLLLLKTISLDSNLVKDPSLHSLVCWKEVSKYGAGITLGSQGASITGNSDGAYYLSQKIKPKAGQFYKVSVDVDYKINNYYPAGIYVTDTSMSRVLGKFERFYSSKTDESWQFVFYSRNGAPVKLVMGFLNGINGEVTFRNVSVTPYHYRPDFRPDGFTARMTARFPLLFDSTSYDTTITRIGDYVNWVLLSDSSYCDDEQEVVGLQDMFRSDPSHPYLTALLNDVPDIVHSYCQKSSLCLGEILTKEFHIPVRQIFMSRNGVGEHQFLEYWNPFCERWIVIDLYFNARYIKDGALLSGAALSADTAPGYIRRFGKYYFYPNTDELVNDWHTLAMQEDGYYVLSFPYQ